MNVKNAFINGDLTKEAYMNLLQGILIFHHKYANFIIPYIPLSKLLGHVLLSSIPPLGTLVSHLVSFTLGSLFEGQRMLSPSSLSL